MLASFSPTIILALICLSATYAFDTRSFTSFEKLRVEGRVSGPAGFILSDQGYCLASSNENPVRYETWLSSRSFQKTFGFRLTGTGEIQVSACPLYQGCQEFVQTENKRLYQVSAPIAVKHLRLSLKVKGESSLCAIDVQTGMTSFHQAETGSYRKNPDPLNLEAKKRGIPENSMVLGVNLEAYYLFRQLDSKKRLLLLKTISDYGFQSIRLHKLYRYYQGVPPVEKKAFLKEVEIFLSGVKRQGLDLYLDILSFPRAVDGYNEGFKQVIFLSEILQELMEDWIKELSRLKLQGDHLFKSPVLKQVCLFNENSLFHEASEQSIALQARLFIKEKRKEESLYQWRKRKMKEFKARFSALLHRLGYQQEVILSNYMTGGVDLEINQESGVLDRHLYLDYPEFRVGIIEVKNRPPLSYYPNILHSLQKIETPYYLSETNLPFPSSFNHELIPVLMHLALNSPLKGVWFYDFRLPSHDFHKGGLFGIQRFRSIMGQLPLLGEVLRRGGSSKKTSLGLRIQGPGYQACSGLVLDSGGNGIPGTLYSMDGRKYFYSFEKARGDEFSQGGHRQSSWGEQADYLFVSPDSLSCPE